MKKRNIWIVALGLLTSMPSCNKFLDTMPDKRTELNRADKIKALLVNAYPGQTPAGIVEHRTDNVEDTGPRYQDKSITVRENYYWKGNTENSGDVTYALWSDAYESISTANQALEAIKEMGTPNELLATKGEALICRAYSHFNMIRVFSHAYNSQTSKTDLGLPYFTKPETKIGLQFKRLSVAESYARIEQDIKEGLPLIDDNNYENAVLKYHFNRQAAYAFAAQFYLYYEKWAKAKEYATIAIGENPSASLRNLKPYKKLTKNQEWTYAFISTKEPCNLLLLPTISDWGWAIWNSRYAFTKEIVDNQTLRSAGGWGEKGLDAYNLLYGSEPMAMLAKMMPIFEMTNKTTKNGYYHTIFMPLTVDKTLMVRAEAEVLLGQFEEAARDLGMWYNSKLDEPKEGFNARTIAQRYAIPASNTVENEKRAKQMLATICKPLNPKFAKPLKSGMQTQLINAVLHAKRILSVYDGERWDDIKRYGIEITHPIKGGKDMVLTKDDPRRAVQIPIDVIAAGFQANPE